MLKESEDFDMLEVTLDSKITFEKYLCSVSRVRIIKNIYNLVSHCLPYNSTANVVNHAIGIMEVFSNVTIVAKLLAKLQEVKSSCRCTYNGVVIM